MFYLKVSADRVHKQHNSVNMDRWLGKVAVVTGASAGIGAAITKSLVESGLIVVGLARRSEKIEELKNELPENVRKNLHSVKCDVSSEEEILAAFQWIEEKLGGVDILVNNAGILRSCQLVDPGNTSKIKEILDTNVMGVVLCTREAFQSMKKRGVNGHVILINSLAGHKVIMGVGTMPSFNIYPASKHAITALTESLRQEFMMENTKIKITVNL